MTKQEFEKLDETQIEAKFNIDTALNTNRGVIVIDLKEEKIIKTIEEEEEDEMVWYYENEEIKPNQKVIAVFGKRFYWTK